MKTVVVVAFGYVPPFLLTFMILQRMSSSFYSSCHELRKIKLAWPISCCICFHIVGLVFAGRTRLLSGPYGNVITWAALFIGMQKLFLYNFKFLISIITGQPILILLYVRSYRSCLF